MKLAAAVALLVLPLVVGTTPSHAQVITSGPRSCPGVALTFDLCPVRKASGFDRELVDFLVRERIPATFFLSGRWIDRHEAHVKELLATPFFEIGTHGHRHDHLPMLEQDQQREEILRPVEMLKTRFNRTATLFRPPFGEYDNLTVEVAKSLGLQFVLWNVVSGDPDPSLSKEQLLDRLTRRARAGNIIVLHANGKGLHTNEVIQSLYRDVLQPRHLSPMTVSDLLRCNQNR